MLHWFHVCSKLLSPYKFKCCIKKNDIQITELLHLARANVSERYDARPFLSRGHSTLLLVMSVRLSVRPSVRWYVTFLKFSLFLSVMDYCEVCKCEILLYCWSTVVLHLPNRPRLLPWFGLVFLFRQSMKKRHVSGIAEPSIKLMTTLCVFH